MSKKLQMPDYLFECSWEVCNKVGGIYTVLSTKALTVSKGLKGKHFVIGPDFWKDEVPNPDFIEDKTLYPKWVQSLKKQGLAVRIGHWNILGRPIALLVDFKPLESDKDRIFTEFWEAFQLDSLQGHQEYIDSAMFGVAAGKIVESFASEVAKTKDKVLAHFHEWMTGSGVLHLRQYAPHVATVFTTHATFAGRSIAGNGLPLYDPLPSYYGPEIASRLHIPAQFSLEQRSAHFADAFTTVSDITARECKHLLGEEVDFVTPNGFEDNFVPKTTKYTKKRKEARARINLVAEMLLGEKLPDDAVFVATSGRYEFKNKGIDVFIDALRQANDSNDLNKRVVAFVLTPADASGAREDLSNALKKQESKGLPDPGYTHYLNQRDHDPVITRIQHTPLMRSDDGLVNVIFVPAYLNGTDGIFNLHYYDLLIGMDLTAFPSYYEPWGYTPLESVAFGVPTVTTMLAGFGVWIKDHVTNILDGAAVLDRNDHNYTEVVNELSSVIIEFSKRNEKDKEKARRNAKKLAKLAKWENLIKAYDLTYNIAIENLKRRIN